MTPSFTLAILAVLLPLNTATVDPPFAINCTGITETESTGFGETKKEQTLATDTWVVDISKNTVGRVVDGKYVRDVCDVSGTCTVKIDTDFISVKYDFESSGALVDIKISDYLSFNRRTGEAERIFQTNNDFKSVGIKSDYDSTSKYKCSKAPLPNLLKAVI